MNYTSQSLSAKAWRRFKKNTLALIGVAFICFCMLIAILGYLITPDSTPMSNDMVLQLGAKSAGYQCQMLLIKKDNEIKECSILQRLLHGCENAYTMQPISNFTIINNKITYTELTGTGRSGMEKELSLSDAIGLKKGVNGIDTVIINANEIITKQGTSETKLSLIDAKKTVENSQIINKKYWLGTDKFGRDILSRLMIGVRITLSVGMIAVLISLLIGVTLGAIAGYFRGWIDDCIMWLINVVWSIPTLLLIFAITLAFGKGFGVIFIAVGLTMWVEVARIIRGQMISLREKEFVEAARSLGFSHSRIIFMHLLPNCLGPVLVIAASNFASAIIVEAGLSFLGIGVQPPQPSWGSMMKENFEMIIGHNPMMAIIPGIAIMLVVLAFNFLGNGLQDAFDVKGKV
jgi:peptide/nickel transport system permease protein